MDAFQILVIILACALAILLILAIVLVINLIKISWRIRQISDDIGETVGNVKSVSDSLKKLASPALIAKIVIQYIQKFKSKRQGEKHE